MTGLLLYSGGTFMQALEGPPRAVEATFQRVAQDPRHAGIDVILREEKERRYFPEWETGFYELNGLSTKDRAGVSLALSGGFSRTSFEGDPQRAHRLLLTFRSIAANDFPHPR